MEVRLSKIRQMLVDQSLDAVIISSSSNIFYTTGYGGFIPEERDAYVLITKNAGFIFTHALYAEAMGTEIPHLSLVEITRDEPFADSMKRLVREHDIKTLGFESENITVSEHEKLSPIEVTLKPVNLSQLRAYKEHTESAKLQEACALTDDAFEYVLDLIKRGVTEKQIESAFNKYFTQHDAESAFRAIVAFGKNASVPHHLAGETKLKETDTILCDFGAKVDSYCADESRTFFKGSPTAEQKKIYQIAYDAQQQAIKYIEDNLQNDTDVSAFEADKTARTYIESQGYPAFPYSLGHGVGLEVHEYPLINPRSKAKLENNMVFTLEPGIHLPGEFGVRIEDVFTIEENKLIKLTHSTNDLLII
jgi:Xaa-Pro aminopeptidase